MRCLGDPLGGTPVDELSMSESLDCGKLVGHRVSPDERCLEPAAPHVCHDFELLQHAWKSKGLRVGWTLWFITARGLMDFFFRYDRTKNRDGEYNDDIRAADYLEIGAWRLIAGGLTKPEPCDDVRKAANKLSAHLTYSRVDLGEGDVDGSRV